MKTNSFRLRKIALFYDFYLLKLSIHDFSKKILDDKIYVFSIDEVEKLEKILMQISTLEDKIKLGLSKWSWNDLKSIEKSVLINGAYEILDLGIDKKIVINEYVELNKQVGTHDSSYKLINAVLDQLKK